jgi:hypothetical protein
MKDVLKVTGILLARLAWVPHGPGIKSELRGQTEIRMSLIASFVAQGHHWIDFARPAGRKVTCCNRDPGPLRTTIL